MKPVFVKVETPLQREVAALLAQSDAVAAVLYPGEYRHPITSASLAKPSTRVLIARRAGTAIGLCVLFDRGDGTVEVKRMIVDEGRRGEGAGTALLNGAHVEARKLGAHKTLLEVGVRNVEAKALYRGAGYKTRESFQPYEASPISVFMERLL
jgi:putative acetyltransferase